MFANLDDKKLESILAQGNYIAAEDLSAAVGVTSKTQEPLADYLIDQRLITKDLIGQAIAESFKIPYSDLNSNVPSPEQLRKIPEDIAKKYRAVLFAESKGKTVIASDQPDNADLSKQLAKLFPKTKITVTYSLSEDIDACFISYQKPLDVRFSEIISSKGRVAPELLEEIFNEALSYRASDIHFEPRQNDVVVRFRIDGSLHIGGSIPKEYYDNILNRIKVKSALRTDEHFITQDGSFQYRKDSMLADFRISIVPTVRGEKVVLRVLSSYVQGLALADIGLSDAHQAFLASAAKKPFGMILVAGPTGSGKTTTLYALLKMVNRPEINITTIEDPVEYKMAGVNQIQTNAQTGLTFAKGLRSIVRQDPDVVLVGEIRDTETAEIAVNAALTGHLLYSTFHANDAATAIPRLLDMGVEPFLLASTLEVVIAQRLVRKVCEHCKRSVVRSKSYFSGPQLRPLARYFSNKSVTLYEGKKCEVCNYTGYKGRTAIFEFIPLTPELQNLIMKSPSTQEIAALARTQGTRTLFEDGIEKVKAGLTTLEELLRVAEAPRT